MFCAILKQDRGSALVEFFLILPILIPMIFFIIDFGRLMQARIILANVAREGGNLASRDIKAGPDLLKLLKASASPLDMQNFGKIYITYIDAGSGAQANKPVINATDNDGELVVPSSTENARFGLTADMWNHLVFDDEKQASDINGITVVEVFYQYRTITPLPNFIQNIFLNGSPIIGSRAVFCRLSGI